MSVYFISARELDLVKIGYSFNPVHRYNHLRMFSPVELTLEGAIPGDFTKERELHRKFSLARVRGEWFKLTPTLQAEIDDSTRPERFTFASVRAWLKMLERMDEERAPVPPDVIARAEARIQADLSASSERKRMSEIERRLADGDIHFPFRRMAELERVVS